jgi:hypothetical protein
MKKGSDFKISPTLDILNYKLNGIVSIKQPQFNLELGLSLPFI